MPQVAEDAGDGQLQLLDGLLAEERTVLVELARHHLTGELRQVTAFGGVDRQEVRILWSCSHVLSEPLHGPCVRWSSSVSASIALMLRGCP
jgi:hypothetical protein